MSAEEAEILQHLVSSYLSGSRLSLAAQEEVLHIAQAHPARDVASTAGLSYYTVRCRRARLYRTLKVNGAGEVMSGILAVALERLAQRDQDVRTVA